MGTAALLSSFVMGLAFGPAPSVSLQSIQVYPASEARQGVAVDRDHFYAITNREIGKYRIADGVKVAEWKDEDGGPFVHLNGGIVMDGKLYGFHSNFPNVPMISSVEVFSLKDLTHLRSIPLGIGHGSLVWAIPHPKTGQIWACFGHYNGRGGTPGVANDHSRIVVYDREVSRDRESWAEAGGYGFPADLIARWDGMTASGGIFLPDGRLILTGHHAPEIYIMSVPPAGAMLKLEMVIPSPCEGQGIALGPNGDFWQIQRKDRTVHRFRLTLP